MKSPVCVFGLVLSALAAPVHAQFPDLIDVSSQYLPPVETDLPPTRAQVTVSEVTLSFPIVLAERSTFLIPGASYHADSMSYQDASPEFDEIRLLQSVDASALLVQMLPSDWSLSARMSAGLAGDFVAFSTRLLRFSTLLMATHVFSDRFVLGAGAISSYAFGTLLPLPVLYLDWRLLPSLRLETFLPGFVNFRYTIAQRVELGLRGELSGNSFEIRNEAVRNDWPCVVLPADDPARAGRQDVAATDRCMDHIAYSVITAGLTVGVRLFATLWVQLFAGHTLYRRLEPMTAADKPIDSELQTLPNVWTVRANLSWRIPRE